MEVFKYLLILVSVATYISVSEVVAETGGSSSGLYKRGRSPGWGGARPFHGTSTSNRQSRRLQREYETLKSQMKEAIRTNNQERINELRDGAMQLGAQRNDYDFIQLMLDRSIAPTDSLWAGLLSSRYRSLRMNYNPRDAQDRQREERRQQLIRRIIATQDQTTRADRSSEDLDRSKLFALAVQAQDLDSMEFLIQRENVTTRSAHFQHFLDSLTQSDNSHFRSIINGAESARTMSRGLEILLETGIRPSDEFIDTWAKLFIPHRSLSRIAVLKLLKNAGVNLEGHIIDARKGGKVTLLMCAAEYHDIELVRFLVEKSQY